MMQSLIDFLTFESFISPSLLIIAYYMGAFFIPVFSWLVAQYLQQKFRLIPQLIDAVKQEVIQVIPLKYRVYVIILAVSIFVMMEVMWRMMFEFFIAYFQMHAALTAQ